MKSDNLKRVKDLSATEAARRFSDVLDAVEHRGESFTIVRRGHRVAQLTPVVGSSGRTIKDYLASHPVDRTWSEDLVELRSGLVPEERRWTD